MSAEQTKILWIIASIAFIIVIILSVGLWWFYPKAQGQSIASAPLVPAQSGTSTTALTDWSRPGTELRAQSDPLPAVVEDGAGVIFNNFNYVYTDGTLRPESGAVGQSTSGVKSAASSGEAVASVKEPAPAGKSPPAAQTQQPAERKPSSSGTQQAPAVKSGAKTAEPAKTKTVRVLEYWIQAASVSSISRAEEVKALILEKGLSAVILPVNVDGKRFYRVRIGPYVSKSEAEKFLGWIRDVKDLEESYISQVTVERKT